MPQTCLLRIAASHRLPAQQQILVRIMALGLAMGCADSGSPTNQSAGQKFLLVGPRVQRAPDNPRFHADTQLIFQGRRDASGACVLEYSSTLKRGELVAGRYSEIDLDTCTYVVQLGTYDRPLPSNRHADSLSAKSRVKFHRHPARPSSSKRSGPTPSLFSNALFSSSMHSTMGPGVSCATQRIWYEGQGSGIQTESEVHVFWEWETGEDFDEIISADAFQFTAGWNLVAQDLQYLQYYPWMMEVKGYSRMETAGFPGCEEIPPPPHTTWYWPNQLTIHGNGFVSFQSSVNAGGNCSQLLTPYFQHWQDY